MTLTPETLGERLRAARGNVGLTQEDAALKVGMQRTALVQIEAGNRAVSSLELYQLAKLYGRDMSDLVAEEIVEEDPLVLFRSITDSALELGTEINDFIEMLQEATKLQFYLNEQAVSLPSVCKYQDPLTYREAVRQGKELAHNERLRLNLGASPIPDMADLILSQSIWVGAVPLRDEVSGLFVKHRKYGLAILINQQHPRARRRFSYAHEYAHALADRERKSTPTTRQNSTDLIEKRANAFASEFLMPEAGIVESLERLRKGGASREYSLLYDPVTDNAEPQEIRADVGAQRITVREVAILANEFMVSYDATVYRLSDLGIIRKSQVAELIEQKVDGRILIKTLKLYDGDGFEQDEQPYLGRQLALLAIEAFRREKITKGRFREVCRIAQFEGNELLKVAEALM